MLLTERNIAMEDIQVSLASQLQEVSRERDAALEQVKQLQENVRTLQEKIERHKDKHFKSFVAQNMPSTL